MPYILQRAETGCTCAADLCDIRAAGGRVAKTLISDDVADRCVAARRVAEIVVAHSVADCVADTYCCCI